MLEQLDEVYAALVGRERVVEENGGPRFHASPAPGAQPHPGRAGRAWLATKPGTIPAPGHGEPREARGAPDPPPPWGDLDAHIRVDLSIIISIRGQWPECWNTEGLTLG